MLKQRPADWLVAGRYYCKLWTKKGINPELYGLYLGKSVKMCFC